MSAGNLEHADDIVTTIASCLWLQGVSAEAVSNMPTPVLLEFLEGSGLEIDEIAIGMRTLGNIFKRKAEALREYHERRKAARRAKLHIIPTPERNE